MKAQSFIESKPKKEKSTFSDVPFTTLANLVTALLKELQRVYVTNNTPQDKKMRSRINKSIEIINNHSEITNIIIKSNPFHHHHHHNKSSARKSTVAQLGSMEDSPGNKITIGQEPLKAVQENEESEELSSGSFSDSVSAGSYVEEEKERDTLDQALNQLDLE